MSRDQITLMLKTDVGDIPARAFISAAYDLLEVIREVEDELLGSKTTSWLVTGLSKSSATLALAPAPGSSPGCAKVVKRVLDGFRESETGHQRPQGFNTRALEKMHSLACLLRPVGGVNQIILRNGDQSVQVTPRTAASVDEWIGGAMESIGAVDGMLEMVSVHGRPRFAVYRSLGNRKVNCFIQTPETLRQAATALGKRVRVTGPLRSNREGHPVSILAESVVEFPAEESLPGIDEIIGIDPDFTGGLTPEQYVREMRDGG